MKTNIYSIIAMTTAALACTAASAQTWRPKNAGLPGTFTAKSVYGDGTKILIANISPSSGHQMYYTPDSSTAFNGSTSSLGLYAAMETKVVKCHGMYFAGGIGGVYKSSDNDVTWTITGSSSNQYTYALASANDTLYANMGNTTQLPYFSIDDGATWTLVPNYTGSMINKMLRYNGVLYAGGSSGFQYTNDMGATWHVVSAPATLSGQNINGLVAFYGAVYASCVNGVFKSTDNGATWTNMTTTPMSCMEVVDTSLFCGTANAGVYRSDMAATTWTNISTGLAFYISTLHYTINDISSNNDYVIVSAQTDPNAIYVMGLSELGLSHSTTAAPPATGLNLGVEVLPNPACGQVAIKAGVNRKEMTVVLYDVAGRVFKNYQAGNVSEITIDVKDLTPGMYFVQVTTSGVRETVKLEVVH